MARIEITTALVQNQPPRNGRFSIPDSGQKCEGSATGHACVQDFEISRFQEDFSGFQEDFSRFQEDFKISACFYPGFQERFLDFGRDFT